MWPARILALFEAVNWASSDASELYGPYNALLDFCFPWEAGWNVVPQFRQPRKRDTLDFTMMFLVTFRKTPVFFLEVNPASHLHGMGSRAAADEQMRDAFLTLDSQVQLPIFHGFSALGCSLSHYKLETETGELTPYQIARSPRFLTDTAPTAAWSLDILHDKGHMAFQDVVDQVKSMVSVCAGPIRFLESKLPTIRPDTRLQTLRI